MSLRSWKENVYPAYLANDGSRANDILAGSCVTAEQQNSWWVVDLGTPMTVEYILFTNHGNDFCTSNYTKFTCLPLFPEKRLKGFTWKPISDLWSTICHMGSRSVTFRPIQMNAPALTPANQTGTQFTNPWRIEG